VALALLKFALPRRKLPLQTPFLGFLPRNVLVQLPFRCPQFTQPLELLLRDFGRTPHQVHPHERKHHWKCCGESHGALTLL
jgi:hypothetical protein